MWVDTTKYTHFLIRKGICGWKHALSCLRTRKKQWNIRMSRLRLVADVINRYEELIQSFPVRSINANNIRNSFCLQSLVSAAKFIAERGLGFRDEENVGSPGNFFQKYFQNFFQAKLKMKVRAFHFISF